MNKIFEQLSAYMQDSIKKALPDVKFSDLEKDGAVFYMNGKNGTEFDWYVNDHFPNFFIFYNDKENLGAVKAILYTDGALELYVYGDKGHAEPLGFEEQIEATPEEIRELAVVLVHEADEKKIWNDDICKINTDIKPEKENVDKFISNKKDYASSIEFRELLPKTAIVSKKVREEGFKICYGKRDEPTRETDSGWFFSVGDEGNDYINDVKNLEIWVINSVLMFDSALAKFITSPIGTGIIRVDSDNFEIDHYDKPIFIEKQSKN